MQIFNRNTNHWLLTMAELEKLPDGTELHSITNKPVIKGVDYIDDDTRGGYLAYGPKDPFVSHPQKDWFLLFALTGRTIK